MTWIIVLLVLILVALIAIALNVSAVNDNLLALRKELKMMNGINNNLRTKAGLK